MVSLGFIVRSGSAFEQQTGPNNNLGATHFLELNAFRSTSKRSHDDVVKELEKIGAISQCISLRENIFYCVDVLKENVETALDILADTILVPTFPEHEIAESRDIVQFQALELPSEIFSRDLVQRAAYQGFPNGNHHYCPLDSVEAVTASTLQEFRSKYFFGENCVLSVVGLEHEEVVSMVSKRFNALPVGNAATVAVKKTEYVGGMLSEERELKDPSFIKVCMGFEVGGWRSPNLVPMCVMQQLLGGGSSFSAGGPGKGMYTRLYTQVLNRHYWAEAVEAFTSIGEDCGLLGIDTSCPPDFAANVIMMVVDQFTSLASTPVTPEELSRAKNMLKSMMMMNLESRLMICEDIARQYSTYGHRKSPTSLCTEIDNVTAEDLMRVAREMLSRPPTVSIVGQGLKNLPVYSDIVQFTKAKNQFLKSY
jgi:processing peptidase subunit alpha